MGNIIEGIDIFFSNESSKYRGANVALLAHGASVNSNMEHFASLLIKEKINLIKIFSPEHGLFGAAQDMENVNYRENFRGIDIFSLYGSDFQSLTPNLSDFENIEVLIADLRDIGSRYYTYIWTLYLTVKQALKAGCKIIITDRVNPLGCTKVEGNIQDSEFLSFVGLKPIPVRHGLTIGELLLYSLSLDNIDVSQIQVIPVKGYVRNLDFYDTKLTWVLPSPNMPTLESTYVYPGMCLLEGTNISEGRGTTHPFTTFGAPFIDSYILKQYLGNIPGVRFRELSFKPKFQKFSDKICNGLEIHVFDKIHFDSWDLGLKIVDSIHYLWPDNFQWRTDAYEFVKDIPAFDLLCGTDSFRKSIETNTFSTTKFEQDNINEFWSNETDKIKIYKSS